MRLIKLLPLLTALVTTADSQWILQNSGATAGLRGIQSIGNGIAWASGTEGTVLRTVNGGEKWERCAIPPEAEHLDFRGIQSHDANTAIVMSSGKGSLSRLYKTTDGCRTWTLLFANPDPDGFWDALLLSRLDSDGELLGDPVNGKFTLWTTSDKGVTWQRNVSHGLDSLPGEGAFAASNSALFLNESFATGFVTGGPSGARILVGEETSFQSQVLPLRAGSDSRGGFSVEAREGCCWVAVGGDYRKPDEREGTAAFTHDAGKTWHAAKIPPHGFRSAVTYDPAAKAWIAVGPNGTDISTDDGLTWRALHPRSALHEPADADRNWNAISLPFVVGPRGRIGRLSEDAFAAAMQMR